MNKSRIIVIVVVVGLIALIGFTLARNKKQISANNKVIDRSSIAIPVSVTKAFTGNVQGKFTLPALVEAENEVDVVANSQGLLRSLNIRLGTVVTKGQVIGKVDTKLKELNLASTQLSQQKLEKDYERYNDLYKGNAVTEVNLNDVKYNYENTKIQAEQIKQQIADANIIAPISGVIVKKNVDEGEYVNPGTAIGTIVNISQLKARVIVSEADVYKLQANMPVTITSEVFPGKSFSGTVRFISPRGDESHNYPVEIAISNSNNQLKAGTFIRVSFDLKGSATALQIPKTALVEGTKNPYVFIANGNKASIRKLVLGREIGENVEVLDGLKDGEEVIGSGQINLAEGSLIQVNK